MSFHPYYPLLSPSSFLGSPYYLMPPFLTEFKCGDLNEHELGFINWNMDNLSVAISLKKVAHLLMASFSCPWSLIEGWGIISPSSMNGD